MSLNYNQIKIYKGINSEVWNQNKKKYIDFSMSNGTLILGHSNKILKKYTIEAVKKGSNFSAENVQKQKYQKLILSYFKVFNRVEFSNSGSEANLRALRICRAITKKNKFAMISGGWHGSLDSFMFDLVKKKNKLKKISLTSGNKKYMKDVIILPHRNIENSIKVLKKYKKKISMIIIETVQASFPHEKNIEYLKAIYDYAKKNKILIVFDEVITGMRVKNISIFKKYNLKPDIVTFGKCFGGGLPIGITCMNKQITIKLNKLKKKVFFGGTFSGNPISSSVGYNTFKFLINNQRKINLKLNYFASMVEKEVNKYTKKNNIKFKIIRYESILRPIFTSKDIFSKIERCIYDKNNSKSEKLRTFLAKNYVFLPKNGCIFISYSHTETQIKKLIFLLKKFFTKKLIY